jgi:hypothetical protein
MEYAKACANSELRLKKEQLEGKDRRRDDSMGENSNMRGSGRGKKQLRAMKGRRRKYAHRDAKKDQPIPKIGSSVKDEAEEE